MGIKVFDLYISDPGKHFSVGLPGAEAIPRLDSKALQCCGGVASSFGVLLAEIGLMFRSLVCSSLGAILLPLPREPLFLSLFSDDLSSPALVCDRIG